MPAHDGEPTPDPPGRTARRLSHALDLTEGQPKGHCIRCCWIGTQLGQKLKLWPDELSDLYYTLLLKDLGCSSNAARICQLYLADDISFKRDFKLIDGSLPKLCASFWGTQGLKKAWRSVSAPSSASCAMAARSPAN